MDFLYYNANPKQYKTNDCVVRALSIALNKEWKTVYKELSTIGVKKCRLINDSKVYIQYLKNLGFEKEPMPIKTNNTKYTVEEFVDELCVDYLTYIVGVAKHLTVVSNGTLIDTWNCSNKCVGNYWIVPGKCDIIKNRR